VQDLSHPGLGVCGPSAPRRQDKSPGMLPEDSGCAVLRGWSACGGGRCHPPGILLLWARALGQPSLPPSCPPPPPLLAKVQDPKVTEHHLWMPTVQ